MASPSTVITLGYGSFGSVNLVPTLGYGISQVQVLPLAGYVARNRDMGWTAKDRDMGWVADKRDMGWVAPDRKDAE